MKRTKINQLKGKIGKEVLIKGWVHEIRDQSNIKFILLRDNSGLIQLVVSDDKKDIFNTITKIPRESVLSVEGVVKAEKQAPGGIEIKVECYNLLSEANRNLPIPVVEKSKESTALPKRLDYRWIDLRKPRNFLIFKVWNCMEDSMREFWLKNGFTQIYSPKFMCAPSESGAELFTVDYFGRKAYLAQSPQFYKQMAMAAGFERVFEIGPVFRANPSHTTRHDTEFTSVDVEMSFIESHEDVMKFEEEWLSFMLKKVKQKLGGEIKEVFGVDINVPKLPFPRLTMKEALSLLAQKNYSSEGDLDAEGEKLICGIVKEKFKHDFVFITEYPISVRPFYHMRKESDKSITKSYDLLWNGLEITTGAQREHRYEILKQQAVEKKLNLNLIEDYLNFFKYGCPPHGGFGLSPTRLLMILLDIKNVREVTFVPRDTERLRP